MYDFYIETEFYSTVEDMFAKVNVNINHFEFEYLTKKTIGRFSMSLFNTKLYDLVIAADSIDQDTCDIAYLLSQTENCKDCFVGILQGGLILDEEYNIDEIIKDVKDSLTESLKFNNIRHIAVVPGHYGVRELDENSNVITVDEFSQTDESIEYYRRLGFELMYGNVGGLKVVKLSTI